MLREKIVGTFNIESGIVAVNDPVSSVDGPNIIMNVTPGKWRAIVNHDMYGHNLKLVCYSIKYRTAPGVHAPWVKQEFMVDVTSGMVGVFDKRHAITEGTVKNTQPVHSKPKSHVEDNLFSNGIMVTSGYGNGEYDCYTFTNEDCKIIAILIDFTGGDNADMCMG